MKLLYKLILVTNFSLFATAFMSNPVFLDVDEMNLVQYDVKIGDQPIVLDDNEHPNIPSDEQVSRFLILYIYMYCVFQVILMIF